MKTESESALQIPPPPLRVLKVPRDFLVDCFDYNYRAADRLVRAWQMAVDSDAYVTFVVDEQKIRHRAMSERNQVPQSIIEKDLKRIDVDDCRVQLGRQLAGFIAQRTALGIARKLIRRGPEHVDMSLTEYFEQTFMDEAKEQSACPNNWQSSMPELQKIFDERAADNEATFKKWRE